MNCCDIILRNVQAASFLAHDILLYLDTHPDDEAALEAYRQAVKDRDDAVRTYQENAMSLTADAQGERFDWTDEPYPWQ